MTTATGPRVWIEDMSTVELIDWTEELVRIALDARLDRRQSANALTMLNLVVTEQERRAR